MQIPKEFSPIEERDGWYVSPTADYLALEQYVFQLQNTIALPVQVICGRMADDPGHRLYLIEDIEPAEVIEQFETGMHGLYSYGQDDSEQCYEEMEAVYKIAAYRPYFADAAGFKARFLETLSAAQALRIEDVLTVGLEGYQSEWSGQGPVVADTLMKENQIRLWWD